jgi:hypothetical protein
MSDIRITIKKRMALTDAELASLEGLVKTGDRASFDMNYGDMISIA